MLYTFNYANGKGLAFLSLYGMSFISVLIRAPMDTFYIPSLEPPESDRPDHDMSWHEKDWKTIHVMKINVMKCHQISSCVMKCQHVKLKTWYLVTFHECRHVKLKTWYLVTFHDMSWYMVIFHNKICRLSWYVMTCHDKSWNDSIWFREVGTVYSRALIFGMCPTCDLDLNLGSRSMS